MKKKALGRGLEALIPEVKQPEPPLTEIDIDRIVPNPRQPRLSLDEERLEELTALVTKAAGLESYNLETEESTVYGQTIDVKAGEHKIEVGSAAVGPHPLDHPWRITEVWVGIGFGLERFTRYPFQLDDGEAIAPNRPGHGVVLEWDAQEPCRQKHL